MRIQRAMPKCSHILLTTILILTLLYPLALGPIPRASAQLPTDRRMIQVVDRLAAEGYTIIGSGSWIKTLFGKKFRDPLKTGPGIEPSDFDMRLVIQDSRASPDVMVSQWRQAGDRLTQLVTEEFQDDPNAARRILQSTNLYPPDQLMAGVKSNEEALERCTRYNRVPNLGITNVTNELDPRQAVGGIYGEGSRASRQFKELSQGTLFGKSGGSIEQVIAAEGYEKFSTKGQASVSRQWGEFVQHWLQDGDNKMAGKYIERLVSDLDKARDLSRMGASSVSQDLRVLAAKMGKEGAVLSQAEAAQLRTLLARADREAAVLSQLGDVLQAPQRGLLQKVLQALDAPGSELGKSLTAAVDVIGVDRLLEGLMAAGFTYDTAVAAGEGDYSKVWANATWMLGLPAGVLAEFTNGILAAAAEAGYGLSAARQSCDDLMAGIFVRGADPVARAYTIDQLIDEVKTVEGVRGFVDARARQAADRGFEGPASEAADWKSAEAIASKCYPVILEGWQRQRAEYEAEYRALWYQFTGPADQTVVLVANPEPAYLDPVTQQVTVQVTVQSLPLLLDQADGYARQNRLKVLSEKLIGTSRAVSIRYLNWIPAPDGAVNEASETSSYTFTAPGEYQVSVQTRLSINADNELYRWRMSEKATVKIHVLHADEKPLCGGGPVVKSSTRTTVGREVIPAGPGQVAKPGVYITAAGDFSATDPMTGYRKQWTVSHNGMPHCEECTCLPWQKLGSFELASSGRIKAVIDSPLKVANQWTMGNSNTYLYVYYEPRIGDSTAVPTFANGTEWAEVGSPTYGADDEYNAYHEEIEVDVPGPGRLTAWVEPPGGAGAFTGSCFNQSYTATVEVLAVGKTAPVNGATKLGLGDHLLTDAWGEAIIVMPWGGLRKIMPNSDISIERVPSPSPDADCQEWTLKQNSGQLRIWSAHLETSEGGGGLQAVLQAGAYRIKP